MKRGLSEWGALTGLGLIFVAACSSSEERVESTSFALGSADLVVSQVYGGGGNSGSKYKNDFIEIFNRGTVAVSVSGWSVQYASATGSSWSVTPLSGTIQPGHYYLVQEAAERHTVTPEGVCERSGKRDRALQDGYLGQ